MFSCIPVFCRAVVHQHQTPNKSKGEHRNGEANVPLLQATNAEAEAEQHADGEPQQQQEQ
jgi:hypothetical protein